jgi:hypothetical protein
MKAKLFIGKKTSIFKNNRSILRRFSQLKNPTVEPVAEDRTDSLDRKRGSLYAVKLDERFMLITSFGILRENCLWVKIFFLIARNKSASALVRSDRQIRIRRKSPVLTFLTDLF